MKKLLLSLFLMLAVFASGQCLVPTEVTVTNITQNSAVVGWVNPATVATNEIFVAPAGSPAPTSVTSGIMAAVDPYVITGLACGYYDVYVRSVCSATESSDWSPANTFSTQIVTSLTAMTECDTDGDGTDVFNLAAAQAQLNTSNPLTYHTSLSDAMANTNPIANPSAFAVTVGSAFTVYINEHNTGGGCDIIHTMYIAANGNCNVASSCDGANSLCSILGVPFSNTVNAPVVMPGIDYDCLFTQPNPTWFYIPISQAGQLDFHVHQQNSGGTGIDVDFICWGPFADPVVPCNPTGLNSSTEVGCSYSAAPDEDFTIANAQVGQYYVLLVTNFSNQPGSINIDQTNLGAPGSGEVGCSGFRLNAFLDLNNNGTRDAGEPNFPHGEFHYEKNNDGTIHNVVSSNGSLGIYDTNISNSYDVSYTVDPIYAANFSESPASYSNLSSVAGAGTQNYYFAVSALQPYNDLEVSIVPNQAPRPGFLYTNTITYTNSGNTAASGTLTFVKDANVTIVSNSETGAISTSNGFTYNYTNLQPFESRQIYVTMQVPAIPAVNIGDILVNSANIAPVAGDAFPGNNNFTSAQIIIGSYDPNDKMESHGGRILISDFTPDDYLYYTIRFENAGTASAENIKITDVLDSKLDETSVRLVNTSHDCLLERTGSQLTWTFDEINLPTVSASPENGKGYVQFKVKPKPGYAIGDVIPNSASIFFDFNPAIVTNTFNTQFVQFLSTPQFDHSGFTMYPNPAGDRVTVLLNENSGSIAAISIYDLLGKTILVKKPSAAASSQTIDVSGISSGIYFLEVTSGNNLKTVKKLVVE